MLAWVPIVTGLLIFLTVRRWAFAAGRWDDRVRAFLLAAALWGTWLALVSEGLSLFSALRPGPVLAAWALPIPFLLWRLRPGANPRQPASARPWHLPELSAWELAGLTAVGAIVAVTGLISWYSAPNTWDSMAYHLPRVMQWAQNGSIAHYATHEPRQLYLSPWAEWVATHFLILGADRAARLIQWLAMTGSLLAVSCIAGHLGAGRGGRVLSVLVAATLPMGLLQAVSTQTDYAVAFHLLSAVCFLPGAVTRRPHFLGAALATGLAVLTKGTAYFVLAPFLAVFAWRLLRAKGRAAWVPLSLFAAVVLILNLGHYGRNLHLFESPLEPRGLGPYHRYGNETLGVQVTLSNAARFATLHVAVPSPLLVARSYQAVRRLHEAFGLDPEDPRTTWPGMRFEPSIRLVHEDMSGNFFHAVLILAAFAALWSRSTRRALPRAAPLLLGVAAGFLLFATVLKWTPWSSRLHLPFFVLATPAIGVLLARWRRLAAVAAMALVVQAVPFVSRNPLHPLTGDVSVFRRTALEQTFRHRPRLGRFYFLAAARIGDTTCSRIGLDVPPDSWEYPLWVVLRQSSSDPPRIENLNAGNVSERLLDPEFEACAVVCLSCSPRSRERHQTRLGGPVLSVTGDSAHGDPNLLFLAE